MNSLNPIVLLTIKLVRINIRNDMGIEGDNKPRSTKISVSDLDQLVKNVLITEFSDENADLIKDSIMFGELSGRTTHGISLLVRGDGIFGKSYDKEPQYTKTTAFSTLIDGKGNPGVLVGSLAMKEVIKLAKVNHIGIVGTKGSSGTTGCLTYYCEKIAQEDLIGIIFSQTAPLIAPFDIKKRLFGTNPIAFAIPHDQKPIIFDMSTSAITYGALMEHKVVGKELPPNVAIDIDGNSTTDPEKAVKGATLPFDASYKGSGLAMMVEILGGVWTGASFEGTHREDGWGSIFLTLSPDLLSSVGILKERNSEFAETLLGAPTLKGCVTRIPGENTIKARDAVLLKGEVCVNSVDLEQIKDRLRRHMMVLTPRLEISSTYNSDAKYQSF